MSQEDRLLHQVVLEESAAAIDQAEAEKVARDILGLKAVATELGGERDVNFRLKCEDGKSYLLKVSHPSEDRDILDFQTQAMLWIEKQDSGIPTQRVLALGDGGYSKVVSIAGRDSVIRVLSYIDGPTWYEIPQPSEKLATSLGGVLARLDRALSNFEHPAQDHVSLWDLKSAPEVAPLAEHIPDPEIRELVAGFLSEYMAVVPPAFDQLPWQVIHGDINPRNVIVSSNDHDTPAGVLDFGDMVYSPRIFDLAVLCAYSFDSDGYNRVQAAAFEYHKMNRLTDLEKQVLLTSIKCRLSIMLCIAHWRSKLHPENIAYIQRSTKYATQTVRMMAELPAGQLQNDLLNILNQDSAA